MKKVGIVGFGQMGSGIAQVAAVSGYDCRVFEIRSDLVESGMSRIRSSLKRAVDGGRLAEDSAAGALNRLRTVHSLEELRESDLLIEAVSEDFSLKSSVFTEVGRLLPPHTILASNTSSLSITRMMMAGGRPDRFIGLHFFNPVPVMQLVEITATLATSPETVEKAAGFAKSLGKTPVFCQDRAGFIVNRLLIPYLLDAVRALDGGVAGLPEIDQAMKLGCGHPMGPFELMDLIGLDTVAAIAETLYAEWREPRLAPPPRLLRLVEAGRLGRKSGAGFLNWGDRT